MSIQTPEEMERFLTPLKSTGGKYSSSLAITAVLAIIGLGIWMLEVTGGHMSNLGNWGTAAGVPWGLDIGAFVWWTGIAIGALLLSALIRVLEIDGYLGFARIGEFLAPLGFLGAFLHILFDLGRPLRVFNTIGFAQFQSPLFWDIVLIGGLVVLSLIYLYMTAKEDVGRLVADGKLEDTGLHGSLAGSGETATGRGTAWWIAAIILAFVPLVGGGLVPWAWSQLGVNMNWFGAVQGPSFLLMSLTTGMAAVLLVSGILRVVYGWSDVFSNRRLEVIGGAVAGAGFFYLVATLFSIQSGAFAPSGAQSDIASALASGGLGGILWISIIAVGLPAIVLGIQIARKSYNGGTTIVATIVLLLGVIGIETLLVAGGLSYPDMMYPVGEYVPSLAEWIRLAGTVSLVAFGFLVLAKVLPLIPVRSVEASGET